ncbi:hypothetical protein NLJ89_g630 [Agrocybe chaxingu]|uniref:Uncharacterized protein n=1 Tax=Agrocybe chaxingu TaxID=84603 RepID=A0A9W8N1F7_9AGAR|nr:hypothetical protein NLJ89_g630 [Agrocybe chaxingu]
MDSIFAIGAGLGVRFVLDAATRHNFKLTGSLVGLWEGVVLLHFLKKMPRSNDPYIAYGVRLFVDFLVTESVARFVVVVIWTGMGMVLADIAPAVWDDAGAKRIWRHFRRDMRTIWKMIPTVAFFPPARTVRFSPSLAPTETVGSEALTPSAFNTTELTPVTNPPSNLPPPTTNYTEATTTTKRQVPGYFPSGYSDTDSLSSIGSPLPSSRRIPSHVDPTRTSRRLSVYPTVLDDSDGSSQNGDDLDEGNLSSASDTSTEVAGPSASSAVPIDTENIPEIEAEEEPPIQVSTEKPEEEADLTTPRSRPIQMPPTPSDSAARWDRDIRDQDEPLGQRPKSEFLPQIPDFLEEPTSEDWEKIKKEDWMDEKELPPTPTEEPPEETKAQTPATESAAEGAPSPEEEGWDTMRSQVFGDDNDEAKNAEAADKAQDAVPTNNDTQEQQLHNRESQPPPYQDDFDDIYGDEAPPENPAGPSTNWLALEETRLREQQEEESRANEEEEERLREEASEIAERLKKEEEEEERKRAEEEAARRRRGKAKEEGREAEEERRGGC